MLTIPEIKEQVSIVAYIQKHGIKTKRSGNQYMARCPFHDDKTPSMTINDKDGMFYCFGCGAKGDIINFVQQISNVDIKQAIEIISSGMGITQIVEKKPEKLKDEWMPILVPDGAIQQLPQKVYGNKVEKYYPYYSKNEQLIGFTIRVMCHGKKEFYPLTYCSNGRKTMWRFKSFGNHIYGINRLFKYPKSTVIVVEGEKCCDDLQGIMVSEAVVISCGNYSQIKKVDLTPLNGRKIILWPDADTQKYRTGPQKNKIMPIKKQAGMKAMLYIISKIRGNLFIVYPGEDKRDGWDVSDGIRNDKWGIQEVKEYIKKQAIKITRSKI